MGEAGVFAPDERVELLDGVLITMPPIDPEHAFSVRALTLPPLPSRTQPGG